MVNQTLDRTFAALGDPTRRAIVEQLTRGEATVTELAAPFAMSLPAVLKHVGVLADAGLIECRKSGRARICRIDVASLRRAESWLERSRQRWERRLDALETYLREGS